MFPVWYNIVWTIACVVVYLAITIPAVISITRSQYPAFPAKASWILLVVILPPIGLIAWLIMGRTRAATT